MATDATLTRTQKNAVLQVIQKVQLDPAEFSWTEIQTEEWTMQPNQYRASKLIHHGTNYYITFGGLQMNWSPGANRKVESEAHDDLWPAKIIQLEKWLRRVKAEVDAPDLWVAVGKERELSDAASSHLENKPFTVVE